MEYSDRQVVAYPAIFKDRPDESGDYIISFPDLNNAIARGNSLPEAIQTGVEVLMIMFLGKREFPSASSLKETQKKYPDYEVTIVTADLADTVDKLKIPVAHEVVTLPLSLVLEARESGINLSTTLEEVLKGKLGMTEF